MKLGIILILIVSSTSLCAQDISSLEWLSGKWQRQNVRPGQSAYEIWGNITDDELKGIGYTQSGADTVFVEKLWIQMKEGTLYYVAGVSHNQEPTLFKFTSITKQGFVCENPEHDFPKKIAYELNGDKLTATISGDGKSIPFVFVKTQ